ncbi:hypothetical protein [Nocardioides sp. HDW12B]|uniref:mycothiol-dependent nitroreductase Rv2466c family protein n=1 Tax=Nocardioides sp. HDW12B TaxID=2714939 RepID=UPI00197D955C|nr:hypothetical protein [Nocardioides sp. HDW12B]
MADLRFYFDPACPFAWMTSEWVRTVREQREYDVEWRFISLRRINDRLDYETHFPAGYIAGHTSGLKLLRVAAAVRAAGGPDGGNDGVDRLYAALGNNIWNVEGGVDWTEQVDRLDAWVRPVLAEAGLSEDLATNVDDESWDEQIVAESEEALALTSKDVGTPILHVEPDAADGGIGFFGPVISRRPSADEAAQLWDHVVGLARFGGFAELKRSLRETPQLRAMGYDPEAGDDAAAEEDWQAGRRASQAPGAGSNGNDDSANDSDDGAAA